MVTGFYDGYDAVALRLPNRPAVSLRPLTVATAARAFRLLDAGDWEAAYRVVLTASRPIGWRARRRARFLFLLRGGELQAVLLRLLYPETLPPAPKATGAPTSSENFPRSLDDLLADYAARYGGPPRPGDPWPLVLALAQRAGRYDARHLYHAIIGAKLGAGSPRKGREGELTRTIDLVKREAYG